MKLYTINKYLAWFGLVLVVVVEVGLKQPTMLRLWTRRRYQREVLQTALRKPLELPPARQDMQ